MAKKKTEMVLDVSHDNTPDVLAYRMGQIENAHTAQVNVTQQGFDKIEKKLDLYLSSFITQKTFDDALKRSDEINGELRKDVADEDKRLSERIAALENWNMWITRIAGGILLSAIIASVVVTNQ